MSDICLYLGKGGCLIKIIFRYVNISGWFESFENYLIHTILDRALLAPDSQLYKQPLSRYQVRTTAHFLQMYQWDLHSLITHAVFIF